MSIKGIFFDLYGTLLIYGDMSAELSEWHGEYYVCLKRQGLSISKEAFIERCDAIMIAREEPSGQEDGFAIFERRIQALCSELQIIVNIREIRDTATNLMSVWQKYHFPDPDCHPVLEVLQHHKILGLISNFNHPPHIHALLRQLDIAKFFTTIVISGDVGINKPDPEIFRLALQRTGLQPDEVVYVGDTEEDFVGARAAGILPVFLQRDTTDNHSVASDFRADPIMLYPLLKENTLTDVMTINSLPELIKVLE